MSDVVSREEASLQISRSRTLKEVKQLMRSEGVRLWLVGGWVRDFFLGGEFSDIDMIVDTSDSDRVRKYVTGLSARLGGTAVALDRERGYWRLADVPQGHLDFAARQGDTIEEDLGRRDFTVNAVAWDIAAGEFVDPCGGIADCQQRILRAVSEKNLAEDPLRNLRAWRFLCTRRLTPGVELEEQVRRHAPALRQAAGERINEELYRIFAGDIVGKFDFSLRTGVFAALWPELKDCVPQIKKRLEMWKLWNNNLWGRSQDWEFLERKYWQEEIRCERSRALFAGLALLLGGTGKPGAQAGSLNSRVYLDTAAHRFSLSRKERNMLYLIGLHASTAELLLQGHSAKGEWFDFFRSTGNEAAFVLLYAWLSAVDVNNEQNLPGNGNKMLRDFFEKGSTYCPQVPLAVKSLLERYPQLQGPRIGELTEHLARTCAVQGGLNEEQAWKTAEDFMKQDQEIG